MTSDYVLFADNEWIEVSPNVKVSGPLHKVSLEGVVSNQPDNDPDDIRFEEDKKRIFVKRRNEMDEDRVFTITYRVNAHGADYFVNKKIVIRSVQQ
jgi:hypothetical protein